MKNSTILICLLLSTICISNASAGDPPTTVGSVNIVGEGFEQSETDFVDPGAIYFLEVNYDGVAPLTINTRQTTDPIDTELALFDATGTLVAENDDFDFPASLLSEIVLGDLAEGQYFLAVGLFNTTFADGFSGTSTSTASGNAVVTFTTGSFPETESVINVPLNYNFNGIVHIDEPSDPVFNPDDPNGFRSISDRALDFRDEIPSNPTLDRYIFEMAGGELDLVHLGNRNMVNGSGSAFDPKPDLDAFGIQPDWLADPDQSGRQTTMLDTPIMLNNESQLQLLFHISNGGGSFDVVVGLSDGTEVSNVASGPDWFGPFNGQPNVGIFPGAFGNDFGFADPLMENTLLLTESLFELGEFAGMEIESISFENSSSTNIGIAIYAANIAGLASDDCVLGDVNQDGEVDLLDVAPFVDLISTQTFQCEGDINEDGEVDLLDVVPLVNLITG